MMRWAGEGSELWRVRVDLFAVDDDGRRVAEITDALRGLLLSKDDDASSDFIGADQGEGVSDRHVVGVTFWVRADDVGGAAKAAVETARRAGANCGVGPELYDVVVIPRAAVALPTEPDYPTMPD
jgi:hypothetical protein